MDLKLRFEIAKQLKQQHANRKIDEQTCYIIQSRNERTCSQGGIYFVSIENQRNQCPNCGGENDYRK